MRVAINGTGIAGPALAYWLRRFGHEPVLFERAPVLRTGGYIIDFWGLGFDLAERMGIVPTLMEQGYRMEWLRMVDARGRTVAAMDIRPVRARMGDRFVSVARSDLSAALLQACDGVQTHFGVSITDLRQQSDGVVVALSNGREEQFDLVVGADGLHSHIRQLAFGPEQAFEHSLSCHVAAFRVDDYPHRDELTYVSHTVPGRQVARVSLRGGKTLILLICRSEFIDGDPPRERQKAALHDAFRGMKWEVPDILARMDDADDLYFDRVSQIHLDRWTSGRVALVGDAAACVSFLAGEGTGLAIVEAYVLAGELHRSDGDVASATAAYEARLRAFIQGKQKDAHSMRGFFVPRTAAALAFRNIALDLLSVPFLTRLWLPFVIRDSVKLPRYEA